MTVSTTPKSWFDMTNEERWSEVCVKQAVQIWSLDETKDIPQLHQLRERLMDLQDYHLTHPLELARCYVDAKMKLTVAEDKFRKLVAWRKEKGVDELLANFKPPLLLQEYYPSCFLQGYDKEGDPIWMDRTGASDVWPVYSMYGNTIFRNYTLWTRETALRGDFARHYELHHQRPPARCTVVLDMDGLCRRHLQVGLIEPLEEGIRMLQDYYGGMAKRIIIINAPFVFRIVWSIAQHFCNDSLKKAIIFCNARTTQETLDKFVDRVVLPPVVCPDEGRGHPGVGFPQTTLEGGIMPPTQPIDLKAVDSNETVLEDWDEGTAPPSPASSFASSCTTTTSTGDGEHSEEPASVAAVVRATSILTGLVIDDRVMYEF